MYVSRIRSNVKGNWDVEIKEKTLISGPSGAGKGAILNSIELALCGWASDVSGKSILKRESDLICLAPEKQSLLVEAQLSEDGSKDVHSVATYRLDRGSAEGRVKTAEHILPKCVDPETALPLMAIRETLSQGADAARQFFLKHIPIDQTAIMDRVPSSLHGAYKAIDAPLAMSPIDRLLFVWTEAKKRARTAKTEAKAQAEVADAIAQGLPPPVSEEEINLGITQLEITNKKLQQDLLIQKLRGQKEQEAITVGEQIARQTKLLEDLTSVLNLRVATIEQMQRELEVLQIPATDPVQSATEALFESVKAILRESIAHRECLCCGRSLDPFEAQHRIEGIDQLTLQRRKSRSQIEEQHRAYLEKKANLTTAIEIQRKDTATYRQIGSDLESLKQRREQIFKEIADSAVNTESIRQIEDQLKALEDQLRVQYAQRKQWESIKKAQEVAIGNKQVSNDWKLLAEACKEAIEILLRENIAKFTQAVETFLPGDRFHVRLADGDRSICQFGLMRGNEFHLGLSGGEWMRVIAAISATATPMDGKIHCIIPEDRQVDGKTLREILDAFSRIPHQVVLSTTLHISDVPGWHVLHIAEG